MTDTLDPRVLGDGFAFADKATLGDDVRCNSTVPVSVGRAVAIPERCKSITVICSHRGARVEMKHEADPWVDVTLAGVTPTECGYQLGGFVGWKPGHYFICFDDLHEDEKYIRVRWPKIGSAKIQFFFPSRVVATKPMIAACVEDDNDQGE